VPENQAFYEDLYRTLREGVPPAITAESARRYVAVLERCRALYTPGPSALASSRR
jgi:hypothetical protein